MSEIEERGSAFWERLQGEPATAYAAFCCYRDMGLTRSLRRAAAVFYDEPGDANGDRTESTGSPEIGTSGQVARFKAWSQRWLWVARVEAFDAAEAHQRSLEFQQKRLQAQQQMYLAGKVGLDAALLKLNEFRNDFSSMPDRLVPGVLRESIRAMQLALGEPTERLATTRDPDAAEEATDLGKLTEEELEEFVMLSDKLWGSAGGVYADEYDLREGGGSTAGGPELPD